MKTFPSSTLQKSPLYTRGLSVSSPRCEGASLGILPPLSRSAQGQPITHVPTTLDPSVCSFLCPANTFKMLRIHLLASQQRVFKSSVHNSPGDPLLRGEMCLLWCLPNACHPGKRRGQDKGRHQVRTPEQKNLFPYHEDLLKMLRTGHLTKISSYMFLHVNCRKRNSNSDVMMRTCNPPNILGMEEAHRSEIPSSS